MSALRLLDLVLGLAAVIGFVFGLAFWGLAIAASLWALLIVVAWVHVMTRGDLAEMSEESDE